MQTEAASRPAGKISEWLEWGENELAFLGAGPAREEGERILETLLGVTRTGLYLSPEVEAPFFPQFSAWIEARKKRIPLAYLLKKAPFWEGMLEVEEGVFIPRPETEVLVESFLKEGPFSETQGFRFLDLGTGSGNIAVTFAELFPKAEGVATDLSEKALTLARRNAKRAGVADQLKWIQADGLLAFEKESFDVIFSNPPYVAREDWPTLAPEVWCEPRLALNGGEGGLEFYRKMLREISCLKKGGSLWVEVGWGQSHTVRSLFESQGFGEIRTFKDLNQIDRVVAGIGLA